MCNHSHLLKLFVGKVEGRSGSFYPCVIAPGKMCNLSRFAPCVIAPTPRRVTLPEICGTSASS